MFDLATALSMNDDPIQAIGRYQIRHELGRGMMGVVYLAHDPDLGRDIALKVIQQPMGSREPDKEHFSQRFFAEARSAARLSHPGIVVVHDVGRDSITGAPYMALQYVKGKSLDVILKERKRLEVAESLQIARDVALALHHAHQQGVIHRDIKPANIMILPTGEPTIMDFGVAKLETTRLTATGQIVGTPLYMSPEQALVTEVDGRSDIFSVGSMLYEMLTGVPAFAGETITKVLLKLIHHEPDAPSTVIASLSPDIDHVLRKCLAKDVHRRYQTAADLANDLKDLLEAKPPRSLLLEPPTSPEFIDTAPAVGPGPWIAGTLSGDETPDWAIATRDLPRGRARRDHVVGIAIFSSLAALMLLGLTLATRSVPGTPATHTQTPPTLVDSSPNPIVSTPTPAPTPVPPPPAQVDVDFEHGLKSGLIRIFIDDEAVFRQTIGAQTTKRIIGIPFRKGRLTETVEVPPGRHTLRVQVSWDDNVRTETTQTVFKSGSRLRLKARLGGFAGLRKDLSLNWN